MGQSFRPVLWFTLMFLLVCVPAVAQHRGSVRAYTSNGAAPVYGRAGSYGGYGFYPLSSPPLEVPPNYGRVGPDENPCQSGCNPNAGYEWDSVGTLILDTNPPNARVTLDGIPAGTTDRLGPFQLPVGEHTLHIEAAGFEPSDIVVKFDRPGVQSLNVELKLLEVSAKPAPRP
ncbi:MAG: PEGA domain-containing protein [Terriglobia bacterium]